MTLPSVKFELIRYSGCGKNFENENSFDVFLFRNCLLQSVQSEVHVCFVMVLLRLFMKVIKMRSMPITNITVEILMVRVRFSIWGDLSKHSNLRKYPANLGRWNGGMNPLEKL